MISQPSLFDSPKIPPFQRKSRTSRQAAIAMIPKAPSKRVRVLEFIRDQGGRGATREEIAKGLGFLIQSVCGRVSELLSMDLIIEQGTRKGQCGVEQAVLISAVRIAPVQERN